MRKFIIAAIIIGVVLYLKKRFGQDNELQAEARAQDRLREVGNVATGTGQAALGNYPDAMIVETPLSGVNIDPFNPYNPASQPRELQLLNSVLPKVDRAIIFN